MSGSSLDGLDIAYTYLEEIRGKWTFDLKEAACIEYTDEWKHDLKNVAKKNVPDFLKLHTHYGKYIAERINHFIDQHNLHHQVHFISSHGHTVFHEPQNGTTCQIGDGATIAAITGLPVISDLRMLDVALGGQGAPIVPIGDHLLFGDNDYWLNIGGIANITVKQNEKMMAFDVCPANQVLNILAQRNDLEMDENGNIAASGALLSDVLVQLNEQDYYRQNAPKSLSNEAAIQLVFPSLLESEHATEDLMHTAVYHIAEQVANAVEKYPINKESTKMLVTGGGAFNSFLVMQLERELTKYNVQLVIPDNKTVKFKEALVMALIGALRWREETNVLSSVTGASKDSISGAIYMGHTYAD